MYDGKLYETFHYTDEDLADYLDEMGDYPLLAYTTLRDKREYGTTISEAVYCEKAVAEAIRLAEAAGCNVKRTRSYTKLLFAAFPAYGQEGLRRIAEYAAMHPTMLYAADFVAQALVFGIDESMILIEERLPVIVRSLLDEGASAEPEMEIAKLCKAQMECLKRSALTPTAMQSEQATLRQLVQDALPHHGIAGTRRLLEARLADSAACLPMMDEQAKQQVYATLDQYRDYAPQDGLYRFFLHGANEIDS